MKEELLNILNLADDYADSRKDRRKGSGATNEFFTPYDLVVKMANKVPAEKWADPKATFLEPSFGNGAFLVEIIRRRIQDYNIDWVNTLKTLYGVELMQDNVNETYNRIIKLLQILEVPDFDEKKARKIMKANLVCSDFFKWDFENWCPIEEKQEPSSYALF